MHFYSFIHVNKFLAKQKPKRSVIRNKKKKNKRKVVFRADIKIGTLSKFHKKKYWLLLKLA